MLRKNQFGFSLTIVLMVLAVVAVVGFAGYKVSTSKDDKGQPSAQADSSTAANTASTSKAAASEKTDKNSCDSAPVVALPVASDRIKSVLYPGQVRGGNFKPHGGFILNGSNDAEVTLPLAAKVIDGVRYNEMGEVQYMFDFETDCGYHIRLDHLHTLSAEMQKIADQLPAPTESSQTTKLTSDTLAAGTVIASKIGFVTTTNTSFDFGFYNMNTPNDASKQADWPTDFQHQTDHATHAVCWFDYLSANDSALVRGLPAGDGQQGKNSVYCK